MRLNVNRYKELLESKNLDELDIERKTGLSMSTINWIFENEYLEISALERLASVVKCGTKEIALPDHNNIENVIEWQRDSKTATVSLTQGRTITRVMRLAESRPEECRIIAENKDGSICARVPVGWIRINPGMNLNEEQREKRADRMRCNILNNDYNRGETG